MNAIISAPELADELAGPTPPVLLDVRWQLSAAKAAGAPPFDGRAEHAAGHLPGAVYVDLDRELAAAPGAGGRHPLPDVAEFGAAMRRAGVSSGRPVVVYDGGQGWAAARAWWLLRWTGHPNVRVLDGGLPSWEGPLSTDAPTPAEGDFEPVPGESGLLDADGAAALARSGVLFDARAGERYRGDVEPIDPVGGHIPGAVSAPTTENVAADGRFLAADELRARFETLGATGDGEVGVYCGSGVSGAHEVLALAVAGIPAALYAGSWSQWSSDPSRPVAVGPEPQ
ncbi:MULTISPECIES: sulfurtransferase [Streptomyces]|uniref:Sulfurtransferase n=1 Tax=Streptomyces olivaceus TaxID=47716 RepID=A0ABS7WE79_STROV|nr:MULTISPECIES: sulfurtransferase [Streptomyces]MBZ6092738.1 sulfurtransferase [Streptomyces olivaceus]MBZ6099611.1 sulfurtransferase [Streptomyces olivaceus]MBZ6106899.1 sulfurtransferase [Streptomyces olivaceus]MBZ6113077.1 sulfurtransferase [Streptomyces olivaceus]MBZ6120508.1 sulfurtransferase [Streptomyces olivaceus]